MHSIYWKWSVSSKPQMSARPTNKSVSPASSSSSPSPSPLTPIYECRTVSKREDVDAKMADRCMISQRGTNPFLDANYAEGLRGLGR